MEILNTGIKKIKNVSNVLMERNAVDAVGSLLKGPRSSADGPVIFLIDKFFEGDEQLLERLAVEKSDKVVFLDVTFEPTTEDVDFLMDSLVEENIVSPVAMVGVGGGSTLDITAAVSNLITNGGKAEQFQGWDLVLKPGVYKIGVPTLSGTGAEATRTCVMTNNATGLKLGMNSDHTVFDSVVLDPELSATVPREQYFFTGMDAYIHCIESLSGHYRNPLGDAYARETIKLCEEVFLSGDMMSYGNREKLMVASYLGGMSIATSYVGLIHPFSAGLSVVLGMKHCTANCVVINSMREFYPKEHAQFSKMLEVQNIQLPKNICKSLNDEQHHALYEATIMHEKPLTNALGLNFKSTLTPTKVREIFMRM